MKKIIKSFFKDIETYRIGEYSAQCSYYIILSFVPFIILLMTLIKYIGIDENTLVYILEQIIPNTMNSEVINVVQEIYSKSIGTISISLIFTLWSADRGFYALFQGFDGIYEKNNNRYLKNKIKSIVFTIIFLLIIVAVLILLPFGNIMQNNIISKFGIISNVFKTIFKVREIILFLGMFVIFLMLYKLIPNVNIKIRYQIPGAFFATIGWLIISFIFSIYLNFFSGFSAMYGSLTTIILLLMWIYICIYIILIGAQINKIILIKVKGKEYLNNKFNRLNK